MGKREALLWFRHGMSSKILMHLEAELLEGDWITAVFNLLLKVGT